jgi:membrane fusion protein (multidrug efflux system)
MIKRLLFVLLFLGLIIGGLFGWKFHQLNNMASMEGPPPPPVVAAAEVAVERWQPRLAAVGSLVATQGIFVTNEVAGQVSEIHFESGETVSEGDLLIQLDDSVDQADLQGLIAQRNLARVKVERISTLLRDRSASQAEFDAAQAELDVAQAAVAAKQALIAKKRIIAPFDGRLGIRLVDRGEYLPPGSAIVPLEDLDPIFADYSLPERQLPDVAPGKPVVVRVAAYPGRTFEGSITAINPGIEARTRTVRIRAALDNAELLLRPGMFAEVTTVLEERDDILTLPRTAITFAPYGDSVFLIRDQEGKPVVQRRQVTTGEARGGRVEIRDGLAAGDRVVIAGQVKLRNDQAVRIDNSLVPEGDGPLEH